MSAKTSARSRSMLWARPTFWPWAIPQMLLTEGSANELMGAVNRVTYSARYDAANAMRLAVRLHDLFSDWRTPAQRTFVLMALKNKLFCEHQWFDWDPALTALNVPPRVDKWPPIRTADPAVAASAVVARSAPELRVDGEFRIGRNGSHVLLETGETIPITGRDRPALRAYLTVKGDPRGQRLKPPEWTGKEFATAHTPTDVQAIPALCQIAGLIEVRPLVVRISDDAEPLTIKPTGKPWNCLEPAKLDYRHTAVLSHLLRCLQRDEYPREPLRGSTPDDLQVAARPVPLRPRDRRRARTTRTRAMDSNALAPRPGHDAATIEHRRMRRGRRQGRQRSTHATWRSQPRPATVQRPASADVAGPQPGGAIASMRRRCAASKHPQICR